MIPSLWSHLKIIKNNKRILGSLFILLIFAIIFTAYFRCGSGLAAPEEQQDSYIDEEIEEQPNSCIYEETEEQVADCEPEPDAKESSLGKEYKYMAESQCMWGTWVISDKMYGGKSGWQTCDDEFQGKVFQFTPHCFWYDGEMTEISFYYATLLAVSDDYPYRGESFERLGLKGDYFLVLEFAQDICPFGFTLISDTEMLLYSGRMLYRAEKTDRDDIVSISEDEVKDLLDVLDFGGNEYIVCCSFVTDFYWEKMIIRNDMTAVFVKGTELYLAKRISNPIDDDIYDAR